MMALAVAGAGCRQADGVMPKAEVEVPNRLSDLSRDLLSVAGGEAQAKQDFADDLVVFAKKRASGEKATLAFSTRVTDVIAGKKLTEQAAQQLAHTSWLIVGATELSDRQVEALQNDIKTNLLAAGVTEMRATQIAAEVPAIQEAVTLRERRWYELF